MHGEVAIADIGRNRLVEIVAKTAIELAGQIAVGTAADIAIGIEGEAGSDRHDDAHAHNWIRPGVAEALRLRRQDTAAEAELGIDGHDPDATHHVELEARV